MPSDASITWAEVVSDLFDVPEGLDAGVTLSFVDVPPAEPGKWVGGVLTPNDDVICIPYSGGDLLKVLSDGGLELYDSDHFGEWEGGGLLRDGGVVGFPYNTVSVLTFDGTTAQNIDAGLPLPGAPFPSYFEGGVVTLSEHLLLAPSFSYSPGVYSMATGELVILDAGNPGSGGTLHYGSAVLLADGESALMVARSARQLMRVTPTFAERLPGTVTGYAGGVLLPDGGVMLMPTDDNRFAVWNGTSSLSPRGATSPTRGYFSGAWSTNGYAYSINTNNPATGMMKLAIINRHGAVSELPLPQDAGVFGNSHYGFTARRDGVIVACPYDSTQVLFIAPVTRRTVAARTMISPWLNKW